MAIQNKTTNTLTGADMARLIKAIDTEDLFKNKQPVLNAIEQHNQLLNQTIAKLNTLIDEHRKWEMSLPRPEQIPGDDPQKTKFTVDVTNSGAVVDNGVVTVRPGMN